MKPDAWHEKNIPAGGFRPLTCGSLSHSSVETAADTADAIRKSGIASLGCIPWGAHGCQFYRNQAELFDILVPYFKAGLENHEYCLWVTSKTLSSGDARAALEKAVPGADRYFQRKQMEVIPCSEWYLQDGRFDARRVMNGWIEKLTRALDRGYTGLRLAGDTHWLEKKDWEAFFDYEQEVGLVLGRLRIIAICTYPLDGYLPSDMTHVIRNHAFALIKREDTWEMIRRPGRGKKPEAVRPEGLESQSPGDLPGQTHRKLEIMVRDRTEALRQLNRQLHQEMIGRKAREKYIRLHNDILKLITQAVSRHEYLEKANVIIRELAGCECAGIRLFAERRRIPRASAAGPGREKLQAENGIFLDYDSCHCARILAGQNPPWMQTALNGFGSFYSPHMAESGSGLPAKEKDLICRLCFNRGYQTMALIPIRSRETMIGAVHLLDSKPAALSMQTVGLIESLTPLLGEGIAKFNLSDKIRENNELLEKIFSTSELSIAYLDQKFDFIRVNAAFARAAGRPPGLFTGKNYFALFPDAEFEAVFRKVAASGTPFKTYAKAVLPADHDGTGAAYWDVSLEPVKNVSGQTEGVVLLLHDVTKRKLAEEELLRTQYELADARRLSDIGTLAATVAHELRNPLAAMHVAAYNIRKKAGNPKLDKHLATIEKKIAESDQIINNLLFYARLKQPEYHRIQICELLKECLEDARSRFQTEAAAVHANISVLRKITIEADPLQIKEVFGNILNNAYEAVAGRPGKIRLAAALDGGYVNFGISDNGPGVPAEYLPHIFDPFVTTKAKGTGLGLTVCRQILNLHGGAIDLRSRKSAGTRVTVRLPMCRVRP